MKIVNWIKWGILYAIAAVAVLFSVIFWLPVLVIAAIVSEKKRRIEW